MTETIGTVNANGVLLGNDDYLFLLRSAEKEARKNAAPTDENFAAITSTISTRRTRATALATTYHAITMPGRAKLLAAHYPISVHTHLTEDPRCAPTGLINLAPAFGSNASTLCWKTDFHLAPRGAIAVALYIAKLSGFVDDATLAYAASSLPNLVEPTGAHFVGEMGERCAPPRGEPGQRFAPAVAISACAYDGPADFKMRHAQEGDLVVAHSDEALVDRTIVIFGTSYANGLLGPLGHIFSTVIWARTKHYVYWDVVKAARPDLVLSFYSGEALGDYFPATDDETPPFMAIKRETGRNLALREQNLGLFSHYLPGLMNGAHEKKPASELWRRRVIGSDGFIIDEFLRRRAGPAESAH